MQQRVQQMQQVERAFAKWLAYQAMDYSGWREAKYGGLSYMDILCISGHVLVLHSYYFLIKEAKNKINPADAMH
jgi:hypothetical protein